MSGFRAAIIPTVAAAALITSLSGCGNSAPANVGARECSVVSPVGSSSTRVVPLVDRGASSLSANVKLTLSRRSTAILVVTDPQCASGSYTVSQTSGRVVGISIIRAARPPDTGFAEARITPLKNGHSTIQVWVDPQPKCAPDQQCARPLSRLVATLDTTVTS